MGVRGAIPWRRQKHILPAVLRPRAQWSAHWARLGVPFPEEVAASIRFYSLCGADGNDLIALPASWDSFGNGVLMMLKG